MARTVYQVFVQRDGTYGVAISELGAMVRTATDFPNVTDAQIWIEADRKLEDADDPLREGEPANPRGH
jgi:hypothetical protein